MLFHKTFGSYHNPTVFLLHGFLGSHRDFFPLIETLSRNFFCVALDLPAHGSSSYHPPSLLMIRDLITRFPSPYALIGYSLGGRIALQLSPLASRLILLSAHSGLSSEEEREKRLRADHLWHQRLLTLSPKEFLSLWYKQPVFSSLQDKPKLLNFVLEQRLYDDPRPLASFLLEMTLARQPLHRPECPTCYLYGEQDSIYKALYEREEASISIPNAGHNILLENPDACHAIIQSWLQTPCKKTASERS